MNLLLDTHALLWWLSDPSLLSAQAHDAISEFRAVIYVSAASAWEIAIKKSMGKLEMPDDIQEILRTEGFLELPITITHALAAGALPGYHADPFDRLLIAQAITENLMLLTRDENIKKYDVRVLHA
ncbi:MAG: PilT protein domain protein [Parcubacteria group bacterium GW2011_GWA2_44_12]|nr:MAG: PilT protein domain protein [Parcubacteria group bacterium GW2011_GWA2_44_12]